MSKSTKKIKWNKRYKRKQKVRKYVYLIYVNIKIHQENRWKKDLLC